MIAKILYIITLISFVSTIVNANGFDKETYIREYLYYFPGESSVKKEALPQEYREKYKNEILEQNLKAYQEHISDKKLDTAFLLAQRIILELIPLSKDIEKLESFAYDAHQDFSGHPLEPGVLLFVSNAYSQFDIYEKDFFYTKLAYQKAVDNNDFSYRLLSASYLMYTYEDHDENEAIQDILNQEYPYLLLPAKTKHEKRSQWVIYRFKALQDLGTPRLKKTLNRFVFKDETINAPLINNEVKLLKKLNKIYLQDENSIINTIKGISDVDNSILGISTRNYLQKAYYVELVKAPIDRLSENELNLLIKLLGVLSSRVDISSQNEMIGHTLPLLKKYGSKNLYLKYLKLYNTGIESVFQRKKFQKLENTQNRISAILKNENERKKVDLKNTQLEERKLFLIASLFFSILLILILFYFYRYHSKIQHHLNKLNLNLKNKINDINNKNLSLEAFSQKLCSIETPSYQSIHKILNSLKDKSIKIDDIQDELSQSKQKIQKLESLTQGFLRYSQSANSQLVRKFQPFSAAIRLATFNLKNNKININVVNEVPRMHYNIDDFSLLIENILMNSQQFCPLKEKPSIEIDYKIEDNQLIILFKDNSVGVKNGDINKLGTPFYSFDQGECKKGIGLGVSTIKNILDKYNAEYQLKNNLNAHGTTCFIKFPENILENPQEKIAI